MNENEAYQVELTEMDTIMIIETMWDALRTQSVFPGREKEIANAYRKILSLWKGPTFATIQMFSHEDGIKAWYNGKSPNQFFKEHPGLLTPVPADHPQR